MNWDRLGLVTFNEKIPPFITRDIKNKEEIELLLYLGIVQQEQYSHCNQWSNNIVATLSTTIIQVHATTVDPEKEWMTSMIKLFHITIPFRKQNYSTANGTMWVTIIKLHTEGRCQSQTSLASEEAFIRVNSFFRYLASLRDNQEHINKVTYLITCASVSIYWFFLFLFTWLCSARSQTRNQRIHHITPAGWYCWLYNVYWLKWQDFPCWLFWRCNLIGCTHDCCRHKKVCKDVEQEFYLSDTIWILKNYFGGVGLKQMPQIVKYIGLQTTDR